MDIFRDEVRKEVNTAVAKERKDWSDETSQVIKNVVTENIEKKKYVVTSAGRSLAAKKDFEAKELPSGKVYSTLYRLYSDAPGAVQCVDRIRDSVLGGGYVIDRVKGKKGSKQDLKKLIAFFDNPNSEGETIEDIVGGGVVSILAYGNWFIEKVPNKRGKEVSEIYNLDSSKMTILVDDDKRKRGVDVKLGYQRTTDFNKKVIYLPSDIIHIKRSSLTGSIYGQAVLETNTATVLLLINAITYNINVMKNGGVPPIQINLPDDSNETDAEAVSRFYETNFGGPWNAGKPMVTFKGAKASALGITPNEMRYLELLEYGTRSVTGMFGVPLILIGIPDGTNRATASNTIKSFYLNKVYPLRKYIANKITQEIIIDGLGIDGWKLDFRSSGLEESDSTRRDVVVGFTKGLYSYNETRVKLGLLPVDGDWAEKPYLLGSKNDTLIDIEMAIRNGKKPPQENDKPENDDDDDEDNPDAPQPQNKPNRTQGEGAADNDT